MKNFCALFTGIICIAWAASGYCQEEPVKPAETETREAVTTVTTTAKAGTVPAQPAPVRHKKEPMVSQGGISELQGEAVNISESSISVLVKRDTEKAEEEEMMFTFDASKIILERVKSLGAISPGDVVLVRYCMETRDYGDMQKIQSKVLTIRYVRPANDQSFYKKKTASGETSSENQLVSDKLSLKGVKSNE